MKNVHERCDRLLELTEAALAAERIQHAATRRAYEELVKETLALKREGFHTPMPLSDAQKAPLPTLDARIVAAIESSTDSAAERERLRRLAEKELANGRKAEQIAADFLAGEDVENLI